MTELIYFLPKDDGQAPAHIAWKVLQGLIQNQEHLRVPIKVLPQSSRDPRLLALRSGVEIISWKKLCTFKGILYSPKIPTILPSKRFLSLVTAWKRGFIIIAHCHGDLRLEAKWHWRSGAWWKLARLAPTLPAFKEILKQLDVVIVHSFRMRETLRERYGVEPRVIPNGIENSWLLSGKGDTWAQIVGEPSIFYHGRLEVEKGVHLLVEAFARAKRAWMSEGKLYIAGRGPLENELKRRVQQDGLESDVIFLGHLKPAQLQACLERVDLAIYPSLYEPFCLAALEAFASCRGVVFVSQNAGIWDFATKDEKTLLRSCEPSVSGILYALRAYQEAHSMRGTLVEMQREFASRFVWEQMWPKYVELINEVA